MRASQAGRSGAEETEAKDSVSENEEEAMTGGRVLTSGGKVLVDKLNM